VSASVEPSSVSSSSWTSLLASEGVRIGLSAVVDSSSGGSFLCSYAGGTLEFGEGSP
jgi:hypothetical protein